jgi:hypothetical protein
MSDEIHGFYRDDGAKINPELIPKPGLCITCKKDDAGGEEEILCILNRIDQKDEKHFKCYAYESKSL